MPFVQSLTVKQVAQLVRYPTTIGKDSITAVTGEEGEGKSLFVATGLGPAIDPAFDIWKSIVYTEYDSEYNEKYEYLQLYGCWALDEAIKRMYKMDFMQAPAKQTVKSFAADVRKEKHAVHFLLIPDFDDLLKYFREKRVKFWIDLIPREHLEKTDEVAGIVYERIRLPFKPPAMDIWFLKDYFEKTIKAVRKHGYSEKVINIMRSHPYYRGEFSFKRPSEAQEKRYLKMRERALAIYTPQAPDEFLTLTQQKWRQAYLRMAKELLTSGKYTMADLVKMSNSIVSDNAISAGIKKLEKL